VVNQDIVGFDRVDFTIADQKNNVTGAKNLLNVNCIVMGFWKVKYIQLYQWIRESNEQSEMRNWK